MAAASSVTSTGNLDVNAIVTQLMQAERQPISKLNLKEASYRAKLTAYGTVKGAVSSFESAVDSLNSTANFSRSRPRLQIPAFLRLPRPASRWQESIR